MGAASPGRWQPWHLAWRMGKTSLWYVTAAGLAAKRVAAQRLSESMDFPISFYRTGFEDCNRVPPTCS